MYDEITNYLPNGLKAGSYLKHTANYKNLIKSYENVVIKAYNPNYLSIPEAKKILFEIYDILNTSTKDILLLTMMLELHVLVYGYQDLSKILNVLLSSLQNMPDMYPNKESAKEEGLDQSDILDIKLNIFSKFEKNIITIIYQSKILNEYTVENMLDSDNHTFFQGREIIREKVNVFAQNSSRIIKEIIDYFNKYTEQFEYDEFLDFKHLLKLLGTIDSHSSSYSKQDSQDHSEDINSDRKSTHMEIEQIKNILIDLKNKKEKIILVNCLLYVINNLDCDEVEIFYNITKNDLLKQLIDQSLKDGN